MRSASVAGVIVILAVLRELLPAELEGDHSGSDQDSGKKQNYQDKGTCPEGAGTAFGGKVNYRKDHT